MSERTRSRYTYTGPRGSYQYWIGTSGPYTRYGGVGLHSKQETTDTTEPYPFTHVHPFKSIRRMCEPLRINGTYQSGTYKITYSNYNPNNRSEWQYAPEIVSEDPSYWITKALANLNPYRAVVNLPLFLFELREFPSLLKQAGRELRGKPKGSDLAGGYLQYSFGWAPLVSDLLKLLDLQKSIADRLRYLQRLENGAMVRRTLYDATLSDKDSGEYYLWPGGAQKHLTARKRSKESLRVWYTARAKLHVPMPGKGALDHRSLSKATVLGLTTNPANFWDAIPWTWLIDYFLNIGDYLEAHDAQQRVGVQNMCLMVTRKLSAYLTGIQCAPGLSATGGELTTLRKSRFVSENPTPRFSTVPILSDHSMRIMASLSCSKALKSYGG